MINSNRRIQCLVRLSKSCINKKALDTYSRLHVRVQYWVLITTITALASKTSSSKNWAYVSAMTGRWFFAINTKLHDYTISFHCNSQKVRGGGEGGKGELRPLWSKLSSPIKISVPEVESLEIYSNRAVICYPLLEQDARQWRMMIASMLRPFFLVFTEKIGDSQKFLDPHHWKHPSWDFHIHYWKIQW